MNCPYWLAGSFQPTLAQLSSEPVGPNPMDGYMETPFERETRLTTLLDEIVPNFIELVREYHLNGWYRPEDLDLKKCHLCQKLAKAEEYRDARKKEKP